MGDSTKLEGNAAEDSDQSDEAATKLLFLKPSYLVYKVLAIGVGITVGLILLGEVKSFQHDIVAWRAVVVSKSGITVFFFCLIGVFAWLGWLSLPTRLWRSKNNNVSIPTRSFLADVTQLMLFGVLFITTFGSFFLSFAPAPLQFDSDQRRLIPVFPPIEAPSLITHLVLFGNGSAKIRPTQELALREFLRPFRGCIGIKILGRGFSSSVKYASNNEELNLQLARNRFEAVRLVAAEELIDITSAPPWSDLMAMSSSRLMKDEDDQKRLLEHEPFNRRVEVIIQSLGQCQVK